MVTKKSRAMMKGKDHYPSRRMPIITVWLIVASVVLILLLGGNLVVLSKLLSANERCSVDLKQTAMAPQTMEQQHASVAATFDRNTVMKEYSDSTNGTVSLPKKKSAQASKEKRTIWRASDISFPPSIAVVPNHAVGTYKYNPVRNINAWPKDDEEIELDPALVAKLRIQAQKIDKGRVLDVLIRAHTDIDEKVVDELPTWENVTNMYGSEPVVLGLDTCAAFREKVPPKDRLIAAAGMFNTGTNFFIQLLERNCWIPPGEDEKLTWPRKSGVFWQVPWGKHNPESWRGRHAAKNGGDRIENYKNILPVVVTKDPYTWFASMCRNKYLIKWFYNKDHCPNLVATKAEKKQMEPFGKEQSVPVVMWYRVKKPFASMAHVWNDWTGAYYNVKDYPRLIVRYEDLLFHAEAVLNQVCACAGGKMRLDDAVYYKREPKEGNGHRSDSSFVKALIRYGSETTRISGFLPADLNYTQKHLRSDLMDTLHYSYPHVNN
mmetsp:Transcript_24368/g.44072  ORF Transcript_24368/g.44072 Transcript_24368/m.44072 type:complete len:491 (-) Transcript_24368:31-1503(-)